MKIEKFNLTDKFIGQQLEFIQRKTMLRPLRFRTEQAIKVAMIGYFKVASGYHLLAILASKINKKGELLR